MMPARLALAVKDDNSRYLSTTSGCVRGRACIVGWVLAGLCSSRQHAETLRVGIESPNTALYLPFNCLSSIIVSAFAGFVTRRHLVMQHSGSTSTGGTCRNSATAAERHQVAVYRSRTRRDTSSHIVVSAGFGMIRAPAGRRPNPRWAGPGGQDAGPARLACEVRYGTVPPQVTVPVRYLEYQLVPVTLREERLPINHDRDGCSTKAPQRNWRAAQKEYFYKFQGYKLKVSPLWHLLSWIGVCSAAFLLLLLRRLRLLLQYSTVRSLSSVNIRSRILGSVVPAPFAP